MKILFGGASLHGTDPGQFKNITIAPPAKKGDIINALHQGYQTICLVDGIFEKSMSVWHKEIILALEHNIAVYGSSSMGALRAVECEPFGMIGIGKIFHEYKSGQRVCDSDVALQFGPAELGYPPLNVTQADLDATLQSMVEAGILNEQAAEDITEASAGLFFKNRTLPNILKAACQVEPANLKQLIELNWVNQKQLDVLEMLQGLDSW